MHWQHIVDSHTTPLARSLESERANRLRLSWFIIGAAFGSIMAMLALSLLQDFTDYAVRIELQDKQFAQYDTLFGPFQPGAEPIQPILETAEADPAEREKYPLTIEAEVTRGDTFIDILSDNGVEYNEAHRISKAVKKYYNPRSIRVGHIYTMVLEPHPKGEGTHKVRSLVIKPSALKMVEINRTAEHDFSVAVTEVPTEKKLARGSGVITSSLYQTVKDAGMPEHLVGELINAYSYDVDFQREIKKGNSVDVLYERTVTQDGEDVPGGQVVFASLTLGKRIIDIYRYTDKDGNSGFYNAVGESIRKALLKTPINGARLSSRFGMRKHPILGYSKMHKGVDFAAPTGTPIYAAGDGVVTYAARKGGYGKYIKIKHNSKYSSAYAHMSRYAKGMRKGKRVKQGQVIGYVGTTGRSTGPHLHYEILAHGKHVNPSSQRFKTGRTLKGKELASFKAHIADIQVALNRLPKSTELASLKE